ncbi:MAG TPA: FtsX-like permease family protein [Gammaproteobacteria bacterium]
MRLFGRLRAGVSLSAAEAELRAIQRAVQAELGDMSRAQGVVLQPLQDTRGGVVGPTLAALFGGAVVLLLVACANVALLSLAQLASRRRELAVRSSIGATRARLMRQAAAEHLVLWSIGGTLGVALAVVALRVLAAENVFPAVPAEAFAPDGRVLLFACAVTLGSAVLFGLVPALRQPLGFRADGLLTFRVLLPQRDYADHDSKVRFPRRSSSRCARCPAWNRPRRRPRGLSPPSARAR